MELVAPSGPVYQAGTLSGNPVAMVAGAETLRALREPGVWEGIERATAALVAGLGARARAAGVAVQCARVGTMFGLFFAEAPVTTWEEARLADTARFGAFHRAALDGGVYLAPSQFEAGFVSAARGRGVVRVGPLSGLPAPSRRAPPRPAARRGALELARRLARRRPRAQS